MMMPNEREAFVIVTSVVRNIQLKRALHKSEREPPLNFWRLIYANSLDMAVIDWCKLFGSENEAVHWKKVIPRSERDRFLKELLVAIGLSVDEWKAEREKVKTYRDKLGAHCDPEHLQSGQAYYPDLNVPLEATFFYYEWLLKILEEKGIDHRKPLNIREYADRFAKQAAEAAKAALAATATIEERVG
jgi:hypothetical protein